jgi:lipopolysaccharide transport system permease protein
MARAMTANEWRISFRLAAELARRNLRARYRSSILGYVWLFLTPVAMAGAWVFLRRAGSVSLADVGTSYPMYVASGMFLWQGFSRMVQSPLQQLGASRHLLGKYRFPWESIVLAAWIEVAFEFVIGMTVLSIALVGTGSLAGWAALAAIPCMALLLAFGGALGLLAAPVGLLYEDVGRTLALALSLTFFLVPIVYPAGNSGLARSAVVANPAAVFLVLARDFLLRGSSTLVGWGAGYALVTLVLLLAAFALLRVARPHVASRVG